jgi:hypothetical protein
VVEFGVMFIFDFILLHIFVTCSTVNMSYAYNPRTRVKSEREPLAVLKKHMGEDRESVPFS